MCDTEKMPAQEARTFYGARASCIACMIAGLHCAKSCVIPDPVPSHMCPEVMCLHVQASRVDSSSRSESCSEAFWKRARTPAKTLAEVLQANILGSEHHRDGRRMQARHRSRLCLTAGMQSAACLRWSHKTTTRQLSGVVNLFDV